MNKNLLAFTATAAGTFLVGAVIWLAVSAGTSASGSPGAPSSPSVSQSYDPSNGLAPDGASCNYGWTPVHQGGRLVACVGQAQPIDPSATPSGPVVTFGSGS